MTDAPAVGCWYRCRICGMVLIEETRIPRAPADAPECKGCGSWLTFQFTTKLKPEWVGKGIIWRAPGANFVTPQVEREREIQHDHFHGKHARCAEIFKETVSCQKHQTCEKASSSSNPTSAAER